MRRGFEASRVHYLLRWCADAFESDEHELVRVEALVGL